jgi:hypothetical protein
MIVSSLNSISLFEAGFMVVNCAFTIVVTAVATILAIIKNSRTIAKGMVIMRSCNYFRCAGSKGNAIILF